MAGLWCEHFLEYGSDAQLLDGVFAQVDGWTIQSTTPPRAGANYLQMTSNTDGILRRIFGAPKPDGAGYGFRFYTAVLPSVDPNIPAFGGIGPAFGFAAQTGYCQMVAFVGSDGSLIFCHGPFVAGSGTAVQVYRTAPCITANTWQYIELFCNAETSGGAFEVRVNGTTVGSYTGNTDPVGTAEVSQAYIVGNFGEHTAISDFHAWDTLSGNGPTDFVGNCAVIRRELDADTAQADWDLSAGSIGYSLLIDKSDATYISAATSGEKSAFGAAALPVGTTGIIYQQVKFRGLKTDAADCDVAPSMISGSDETAVTGQAMTSLETWRWGIFAEDPTTSAPWTLSAANASTPALTRTA